MTDDETVPGPFPTLAASEVKVGEVRTGSVFIRAQRTNGQDLKLGKGYQFRHLDLTLKLRDGAVVTATGLTHDQVLRIIQEHPNWARQNITRGWYPPEDPYWGTSSTIQP